MCLIKYHSGHLEEQCSSGYSVWDIFVVVITAEGLGVGRLGFCIRCTNDCVYVHTYMDTSCVGLHAQACICV